MFSSEHQVDSFARLKRLHAQASSYIHTFDIVALHVGRILNLLKFSTQN